MPRWTPEARKRHSQLMQVKIHETKPWLHSTGAKTPEGKRTCSLNALKHGGYSRTSKAQLKLMRQYLKQCTQHLDDAMIQLGRHR